MEKNKIWKRKIEKKEIMTMKKDFGEKLGVNKSGMSRDTEKIDGGE